MNVAEQTVDRRVRMRVFTPKGPGPWPAVVLDSQAATAGFGRGRRSSEMTFVSRRYIYYSKAVGFRRRSPPRVG